MDNALKISVKALIASKRGFEFEAVINQIHLIRHGSDGYLPTRERRDDGCEGIIVASKTVVAAYGPDSYNEKNFNKKVDDDFDDFLNKWAATYPNWKMFYNGALAPDQIRMCEELKKRANDKNISVDIIIIKGIDQLIQFIEDEFSSSKIRQLASSLNVAKELISFDQIREIINDLIQGIEIEMDDINYDLKVDIGEKIKLNYTDADQQEANEEYEDFVISGVLKKIGGIISIYNSEQINILKMRIVREFNNLVGDYKQKLNNLVQQYLERYSSGKDDEFEHYIRALLVYCFEQCMIGTKTKKEIGII